MKTVSEKEKVKGIEDLYFKPYSKIISFEVRKEINGMSPIARADAIIKMKNVKASYLIARYEPSVDKKALEKIVLESKDPEISCYFARDIEGADKKAHEQIVLESKDIEQSYYFARDIEGANVEEHKKIFYGHPIYKERFDDAMRIKQKLKGKEEKVFRKIKK